MKPDRAFFKKDFRSNLSVRCLNLKNKKKRSIDSRPITDAIFLTGVSSRLSYIAVGLSHSFLCKNEKYSYFLFHEKIFSRQQLTC